MPARPAAYPRPNPPARVRADEGPLLFAALAAGPSLESHRAALGVAPRAGVDQAIDWLDSAAVAGRGGAGFPFATKLKAVAGRRRPVVVVNAAEGEPASAKDTALALFAPHSVLDGAAAIARALRVREVTVVVPSERPAVGESMLRAIAERSHAGERMRWRVHEIAPGFVSGQARSVLESLSGRPALPVTAWAPEAIDGLRGRPTLLSNAETWAHVGCVLRDGGHRYAAHGTTEEPGTTLLTLPDPADPDGARVVEVDYGTPWRSVLAGQVDRPVLLGGFHGTWAPAGALDFLRVSRAGLAAAGLALGAGVVLPLPVNACPIRWTARIVDYLAGQSARRCGPCRNGLPALAVEVSRLADGEPSASLDRIRELAGVVTGRGACAHPDGTARLVRSLLDAVPDEVGVHLAGSCTC